MSICIRSAFVAIGFDRAPAEAADIYHPQVGDTEAILSTFEPGGYVREPIGPDAEHRGTDELRSFYAGRAVGGGGIGLEHYASTDDGVRCALEYNCVRWGSHQLPPQAALTVYERGSDGLLAAARIYGDVEAPA